MSERNCHGIVPSLIAALDDDKVKAACWGVLQVAQGIARWDEGGRRDSSELDLHLLALYHRLAAFKKAMGLVPDAGEEME